MILFLDDDPKRAALAYKRMDENDQKNTIWCKTVEEALTTIIDYSKVLNSIFLEHDLEGMPYANTKSENSGMEVIRFLEKLNKNYPDKFNELSGVKIIVHTWNEHAGPIMIKRLSQIGLDVEYKPFGM